jgi:hypothetical protein
METQMGLTVIGPDGQSLRLLRNHPAFLSGRNIVREAIPAEQQWSKLRELMANPLRALSDWCARFGIRFVDQGATLKLGDCELNREGWLPLLQRCHSTAGSPEAVMLLAEKIRQADKLANLAGVCLHLRDNPLRGKQVGIVTLRGLPPAARAGDLVDMTGTGTAPYLVSHDGFLLREDGTLQLRDGIVLGPTPGDDIAKDVLAQPVILGNCRTYRCEEGSADGWLEDNSFDSLMQAIGNARDIQKTGSEARVINRITGDVVAYA